MFHEFATFSDIFQKRELPSKMAQQSLGVARDHPAPIPDQFRPIFDQNRQNNYIRGISYKNLYKNSSFLSPCGCCYVNFPGPWSAVPTYAPTAPVVQQAQSFVPPMPLIPAPQVALLQQGAPLPVKLTEGVPTAAAPANSFMEPTVVNDFDRFFFCAL